MKSGNKFKIRSKLKGNEAALKQKLVTRPLMHILKVNTLHVYNAFHNKINNHHIYFSSMAWHPSKAELSVMDMTGHWGVITKLDNETVQSSKSSSANVIEKTGKVDKIKKKEDDLDDLGDDDEMLNDEEVVFYFFRVTK
jgi:hypothetical protein